MVDEKARCCTVYFDAIIALPLTVYFLMERLMVITLVCDADY